MQLNSDTGLEGKYDPQNGIAQVVRGEMKGVAIIFQNDHVISPGGQRIGVYFDFRVSSLSKVRNGPAIVPCCQTTNKSQVAPASAMGTMSTFGTFR